MGSTGLGLDIVRRVAESTGGDVRIGRSVLGGTEVRIWIGLDGQRPQRRGRGHRVGRPRRGVTGLGGKPRFRSGAGPNL